MTPGAARTVAGGGAALRTGLASSMANAWFLTDPSGPVEPHFAEAFAFFGPRHPWRVVAEGPWADEVQRAAVAHHLVPIASEPGMLLDPIRSAPALPPGLTVRPVASRTDLVDFGTVWCAAFEIPRWIFGLILPTVLADDPERGAQNRLLVGYVGGAPVACSSVTVTERVAGVFSVGTTRPARGHGYGTAMTWQAVEEGRRLGADVAYLAATTLGYPVYERMGFRRVAEYPSWATPVGFFRQIRLLIGMWSLARAARTSPNPP